jgi:hypothetical protein
VFNQVLRICHPSSYKLNQSFHIPFIYEPELDLNYKQDKSNITKQRQIFFPTIKFLDFSRLNFNKDLFALHPVAITLVTTIDDSSLHKKWLLGAVNEIKQFRMKTILNA